MTNEETGVATREKRRKVAPSISRTPATISVIVILLAVGILGQGLWRPVTDQSWWETLSYGLPSFEDGSWWTPLTGTFLVVHPSIYVPTVIGFVGMAYLEWRRGWKVALLWFGGGQLAGILGSALLLQLGSLLPWQWAIEVAAVRDVGPSGGAMACLAVAASLLPRPWRQRVTVMIIGYIAIGLLFLGTLADLEHAVAVVIAISATRSIRFRRASSRERRLLASVISLCLGAIQIVTLLIPTAGPFGETQALDGPWLDVVIDAVVILFVTNGLRRGRRWAWLVTVVVATLNVLSIIAYIVPLYVDAEAVTDIIGENRGVATAHSILWLAYLILLIAVRGAFSPRRDRRLTGKGAEPVDVEVVRRLVKSEGGGSLSWMTTWEGMQYQPTPRGIVAYQEHLGVAIALADPLGPAEALEESARSFIESTERAALIPCFFSASDRTKDVLPAGWRSLIIADDTIVDLPGLTFTGKAWSHVRSALNRATREGVTVRVSTWAEETWGIRQQIRAVSDSWVGDKDLPEMRFTLGTLAEAEDPDVRIALAVSPVGDVEGFLSWLPVFGADGSGVRGWTLDLMRRREGGFGPVMELLIGASAQHFAQEGAQTLSLSGAPLAHQPSSDEGTIARLLTQVSSALEPVYGFTSLHRFKQKFNPRYEPIYLLYRDEGDLTRIGPALVRAFLPDATMRQMAAAGLEMVRRD